MENFLSAHIEEMSLYLRRRFMSLLQDKNITSVGIGYRRDGKEQAFFSEPVIQFTVEKKLTSQAEIDSIGSNFIPKQIDGFNTDVIERSFQLGNFNPDIHVQESLLLRPGAKISSNFESTGTLGAIVYGNNDSNPLLLTNQHVLPEPINSPVYHHIRAGGRNQLLIGNIRNTLLDTKGDAAIATLIRPFTSTPPGLMINFQELAPVEPNLGDRVIKYGAYSHKTRGIVNRIQVYVKLNYPKVGEKIIHCFEITPNLNSPRFRASGVDEISVPGDSGSVWYREPGSNRKGPITEGVGLHFAGETAENPREHALACYLTPIFSAFNISFSPNPTAEFFLPHPQFQGAFVGGKESIKEQENSPLASSTCSVELAKFIAQTPSKALPEKHSIANNESSKICEDLSISVNDAKVLIREPFIRENHPDLDGEGLRAYVIDTGIYAKHEEFQDKKIFVIPLSEEQPSKKKASTEKLSNNDPKNLIDRIGHGTHISAIIAGSKSGIAPKAELVPFKVYDRIDSVRDRIKWVIEKFKARVEEELGAEYEGATTAIFKEYLTELVEEVLINYYLGIEAEEPKGKESISHQLQALLIDIEVSNAKRNLFDQLPKVGTIKNHRDFRKFLTRLRKEFETRLITSVQYDEETFQNKIKEHNKKFSRGLFSEIFKALKQIDKEVIKGKVGVVCIALGDISNNEKDDFARFHKITECIRTLREKRIPVIISAGNAFIKNGSQEGMNYPSIIQECISVGAIFDCDSLLSGGKDLFPDTIYPYRYPILSSSQRLFPRLGSACYTTIFAPGGAVESAGNSFEKDVTIMTGSSMATAFVAGALLLLQQAYIEFFRKNSNQVLTSDSLPSVDLLIACLRSGVSMNDSNPDTKHFPKGILDLQKSIKKMNSKMKELQLSYKGYENFQ